MIDAYIATLKIELMAATPKGWVHFDPFRTDLKHLLSDPDSPYQLIVFSIEDVATSRICWVQRFLPIPLGDGVIRWAVEGMTSSSPIDGKFHDKDDAIVHLTAMRRAEES